MAQPLPPSSPAGGSNAGNFVAPAPGPSGALGGPGSVLVSEIDLSSPLNYGTPSSVTSSHLRTPRSVRGTPIRIRSDIQSEKRLRQVNVTPSRSNATPAPASSDAGTPRRSSRGRAPPSEVVPPSETSDSAPHLVIWGTDVSVQVCKQKFKRFLTTFVDPNVEEDERMEGFKSDEPIYMQRLAEVITYLSHFRICLYL